MAIRSVGQLGPSLDEAIAEGEVWFDVPGAGTLGSPQLGSTETDTEGNLRIYVQASAAIAAAAAPGTQVTVTRPAFTAATGAGGAFAPVEGMASGGFFWARVPIDVTA